MLDIESMTLVELKELAKEYNIKNISKLKKNEIVTVLSQITNQTTEKIEDDKTEEVEASSKRQYNANGEPIVDYKLTSDGDEIV